LVSRENLLRKVQAALQTHKSDAPTAEAAIDDRLAVLKSAESSRDALREALKGMLDIDETPEAYDAAMERAIVALAETPTEG
jgi:anti-sigma factor ChrR (cupin superfamily)